MKIDKNTCRITFNCRRDVERRPSACYPSKPATRPDLLFCPLHTVQYYSGISVSPGRLICWLISEHISRRHSCPTTRFLCSVSSRRQACHEREGPRTLVRSTWHASDCRIRSIRGLVNRGRGQGQSRSFTRPWHTRLLLYYMTYVRSSTTHPTEVTDEVSRTRLTRWYRSEDPSRCLLSERASIAKILQAHIMNMGFHRQQHPEWANAPVDSMEDAREGLQALGRTAQ